MKTENLASQLNFRPVVTFERAPKGKADFGATMQMATKSMNQTSKAETVRQQSPTGKQKAVKGVPELPGTRKEVEEGP